MVNAWAQKCRDLGVGRGIDLMDGLLSDHSVGDSGSIHSNDLTGNIPAFILL